MIHIGDCLDVMRGMEAESIDAIVTDPPYGLSFMGKNWDHGIPGEAFWREALRIAKPGTHLLAFGGSRTYHRLTVAIEDAGWEVRDCIMWVYGSGFPKSLDVSKAIDKEAGKWRGKSSGVSSGNSAMSGPNYIRTPKGKPITAAAAAAGWGTALKPAYEPIVLARKPIKGTVAANVQEYGTGAVNVNGCRVASSDEIAPVSGKATLCGTRDGYDRPWKHDPAALAARQARANVAIEKANTLGRWPANFIHDGSNEVTGLTGEAARFFYCAKASKADREEGCERLAVKDVHRYGAGIGEGIDPNAPARNRNHHPTVKPNSLMRYLCRLVTPPGGIVLDPFCGSGSTGKAAIMEGFRFIGIEKEAEYAAIAQARIDAAKPFVERMENKNEPRQLCLIYH